MEGRSGDNLDAILLSPEAGEGNKLKDDDGKAEVVKECFKYGGVCVSSRLKHDKSINNSAAGKESIGRNHLRCKERGT